MATESTPAPAQRLTIALTRRDLPPGMAKFLRYLARSPDTEICAVFIEDSDLLKAAALPFTVEFCSLTCVTRPISQAQMETHFRREAAAAQSDFARVAGATGRRWRFEVLRGSRRSALAAALDAGSAILWPRRATRLSAAHEPGPVVAVVEDAATCGHALELARSIAEGEGASVETFELGSHASSDGGQAAVIRAILRRSDPLLVVFAASVIERMPQSVGELDETAGSPLLILR